MAPFPLPLNELLGHWGAYVIYLLIGISFGFVLEIAGFGNSKKLAAQFYFKDLTVLKVMFSAIVVAMVLIFGATAVGLLDYNLIWVNPTYLWPGIIGGLIMGFGFIIGPEGQDIFVHYSCIDGEGFRVLKDGASVIYDAEQSDKGWKALKVQRPDPSVVVPRRQHTRTPRR